MDEYSYDDWKLKTPKFIDAEDYECRGCDITIEKGEYCEQCTVIFSE